MQKCENFSAFENSVMTNYSIETIFYYALEEFQKGSCASLRPSLIEPRCLFYCRTPETVATKKQQWPLNNSCARPPNLRAAAHQQTRTSPAARRFVPQGVRVREYGQQRAISLV